MLSAHEPGDPQTPGSAAKKAPFDHRPGWERQQRENRNARGSNFILIMLLATIGCCIFAWAFWPLLFVGLAIYLGTGLFLDYLFYRKLGKRTWLTVLLWGWRYIVIVSIAWRLEPIRDHFVQRYPNRRRLPVRTHRSKE